MHVYVGYILLMMRTTPLGKAIKLQIADSRSESRLFMAFT